jgi:hypothetical protein
VVTLLFSFSTLSAAPANMHPNVLTLSSAKPLDHVNISLNPARYIMMNSGANVREIITTASINLISFFSTLASFLF